MPPQAAPAQPAAGGPPPQGPEGGGAGGGVGQVLVETDKNLAALAKAAPPEFADQFAQIAEAFRNLVDEMMQGAEGGGGGPSKPQPAGGTQSPEAGGNPNARPAGY